MAGTCGVTRLMLLGNTKLVPYGIAEEQSDIRAHVSVVGRVVYVYPTVDCIATIDSKTYPKAPAYQKDIQTAEGYLVPPDDITHLKRIQIPDIIMGVANFSEYDNTSLKGNKAVFVVKYLLRAGLFPLWTEPTLIDDVDMQVSGMDIIVKLNTRIQVKCDWKAGTEAGCTGNLYIQTAECNPFGMH